MPHLLFLTGLCLLGASLLVASHWKRYRIRHTGTLVMAKVTQVRSWEDSAFQGFSMWTPRGWHYEVISEWTDPHTGETYSIRSETKNGLPKCQSGDYLPAYISPYGNYMKLS